MVKGVTVFKKKKKKKAEYKYNHTVTLEGALNV